MLDAKLCKGQLYTALVFNKYHKKYVRKFAPILVQTHIPGIINVKCFHDYCFVNKTEYAYCKKFT